MFKIVLLLLLSFNIFALEISLAGAKEKHEPYSTLHLKHSDKFLCQEFKDDFENVIKIVCAFSKLPSQKIEKLQNSFFEIESEVKKDTFFLIIKPYKKMKLYPMVFNLIKEETLFSAKVELSEHWMIVGYKDEIPYIKKEKKSSLNIDFPYTSHEDKFPYVGSLDIKGNPVNIKRVGDAVEYIKIKKLYEDKSYEPALDLCNEVIKEYPNSLFRAELLFYKIRAYSKLNENDKLIEVAKEYLREYSYDENVAEVLSLIARSYNKVGLNSDADYFYDRLFSEHYNSVYAKWGYIYMAEVLEASGNTSKAQLLYEKALSETEDIDVAVVAAFKLSRVLISSSKMSEAAKHIEKIALAKPNYFMQDKVASINMMYDFAESSDFISAATVAKALYENMDFNEDEYEELIKNVGIWLTQSSNKKEALGALNIYIEKFPDGIYLSDVVFAKDSLFFELSDDNATTKLETYDKLINEYIGDRIGDKALYEKVKLLIEQNMFNEALLFEDDILKLDMVEYGDIPELITDAAIGAMELSLKQKECSNVLFISSKYNIELSSEWDDGIYVCAMKGGDFELAKKMAGRNMQSQDLELRKKWLYRYIKIDFATGNYSNVIEASKELITLINSDKGSPYLDVYRDLFDIYHRLENRQKMIESIAKLINIYGEDYIDIDRYVAVMGVGSDIKDVNLVIEYGGKVLDIQKKSASSAQTPHVEFTLYEAYIQKENYNKALEIIESLENAELSKNNTSRQKYLLGSVLERLWRDEASKRAYQEAIDADPTSAWAGLAKSAKALF